MKRYAFPLAMDDPEHTLCEAITCELNKGPITLIPGDPTITDVHFGYAERHRWRGPFPTEQVHAVVIFEVRNHHEARAFGAWLVGAPEEAGGLSLDELQEIEVA